MADLLSWLLHGFTQICVARGIVSWGSKDNDAAGGLQLWYRERDNNYCINASKTARGDALFYILPETTMRVTEDTVTISELRRGLFKGQTVQLKDADPNELQLFIDKMPATIRGKKPSERAKVMFPYEPENPDELKLVKGDIITILNKDGPDSEGWWEGEVNGKVGMFPNNFVKLLPSEEEDTSVKDKAPVAPVAAKKGVPVLPVNLDELKKSPSKKPSERAKVMFSYDPENPDELKLFKGDIITILNKDVPDSEGWWEGEVNGKVGMFPNNFVRLLPSEEEDTSVKDKAPFAPAAAKKGVPVLPVNLDEFKESPKKMQDLREGDLQKRASELERQLRDSQQREENSQRQLREMAQREGNLARQLRELQKREQNSQRLLTGLRQREGNSQRQLREVQEREEDLLKQLRELQEREQNTQRQLREIQRQLSELRKTDENSQMQLRETRQQLTNCHGQVSELQSSLLTAQQTINQLRSQETRDWVIPRDEIQITDKCLGRGGWGSVNEGTYCGCTVAVKEIHELILSAHNVRRFEREINIASKCRHPHLLQFIGATVDEGSPLFVTELMETSLRALLEQRQLAEIEICTISLDVARALNYLHQKKPEPIIHRDVSSANVLLWRQGDQWRAKVSDYGTANFMQQTMTVAPGAMIYSAPEAFTPNQTVKVDVYSFGVLLCEMCIRELPDPTKREEEMVLVTNGVLRDLVRRCLQRDPGARPTMQGIIDEMKDVNVS